MGIAEKTYLFYPAHNWCIKSSYILEKSSSLLYPKALRNNSIKYNPPFFLGGGVYKGHPLIVILCAL